LSCIEAKLLTVESGEYGAVIRLKGDSPPMFYSRKSGNFDAIVSAIQSPKNQPVTLCYRAESLVGTPDKPEKEVFEIILNGRKIRNLEQVGASWQQDYEFLWFVVPIVLVASTYLAFRAGTFATRNQE
jgi:hypothetical protein